MKIPRTPPVYQELLSQILKSKSQDDIFKILDRKEITDQKGRYSHWDKICYLEPPEGFNHDEWWISIKMARRSAYKCIPINNFGSEEFNYTITDNMSKELHWLDRNASGSLTIEKPILNTQLKNSYIISSLIEESITSSQLEGAATTRRVAKKMIQEGRKPRDKSEYMILNNYRAMQFIRGFKNDSLTPEIILELHKVITENTLTQDSDAGRYRLDTDNIKVVDENGMELFSPPPAKEIEKRISDICDFANRRIECSHFIHPVVRSILIHFLLSYTHPFVDGNGRTARALFYWSMLKEGYWLSEFISISKILRKAPAKYGYAFLYTESDENDVTYFIDHQLKVIHQAIDEFRLYLARKLDDIESTEKFLKRNKKIRASFNHRQYSVIKHALKHPGYLYSIHEHQAIHGIAYDTARKDLSLLADSYDLLVKIKDGKSFKFLSPNDLRERIETNNDR